MSSWLANLLRELATALDGLSYKDVYAEGIEVGRQLERQWKEPPDEPTD